MYEICLSNAEKLYHLYDGENLVCLLWKLMC